MSKTLTIKEFIFKAKRVHGEMYDYSKSVYVNAFKNIKIICPIHGEFEQRPNNHLNGNGCVFCAIQKNSDKLRSNTEEFIKKSKLIHKTKYDYSLVNYKGSYDNVIIKCKIHGNFSQRPLDHLLGKGCQSCNGGVRYTKEKFLENAKFIHKNRYDYSKVLYVNNNNTKIEIICNIHGSFFQVPASHIQGESGCPKCMSSKGELKIEKILHELNVDFVSEKKFVDCRNPKTNRRLMFDFYIPSKNLLIEYDGEQHFGWGKYVNGRHSTTKAEFNSMVERDGIKTEYAKRNGIRLLRIKYTKFNEIESILRLTLKKDVV